MTEQQFNESLGHFSGSEKIYKHFLPIRYTDGVKWACENAGNGCFWFLDIIGSWQPDEKLKGEGFQVWKLKKTSNNKAVVTCDGGNKNILLTQNIPYTDFPYSELTFWCVEGIVLLPGEY